MSASISVIPHGGGTSRCCNKARKDTNVIQIGREETELCFCRNKNVKHNTIYNLKNMQYLGAHLTKHVHELYIENNKMQMKEMLKDLNK